MKKIITYALSQDLFPVEELKKFYSKEELESFGLFFDNNSLMKDGIFYKTMNKQSLFYLLFISNHYQGVDQGVLIEAFNVVKRERVKALASLEKIGAKSRSGIYHVDDQEQDLWDKLTQQETLLKDKLDYYRYQLIQHATGKNRLLALFS